MPRLAGFGLIVGLALTGAGPATAPAVEDEDKEKLPVVVLVGDSIRLGYAPFVAERLQGKAKVVSPQANGGDSGNVLKHLDEWVIAQKPAVVHLNAGLHDLKLDRQSGTHQVELDAYRANLENIRDRIEAGTSARLIFATTTPVLDERHQANKPFDRKETDVEAYNKVALEVMASPSIAIDDLHALVMTRGRESALVADGVHYHRAAYQALAAQVAAAIESALNEPEATRQAVCRWASTAPVLDGKLDDPAWAKAAVIDTFPSFWSGRASDGRTRARLVWDDKALYFAATMADAELRSFGTQRNDSLWNGDVFEIFFKPDADKPAYYEFQANPKSVVFEVAWPRRGFQVDLPNAPVLGTKAVAVVEGTLDHPGDRDQGWTVEGMIPWSAFQATGGKPSPGDSWRFALCRYDYGPEGTKPLLMSSAPLRQPSFHRYEDYGTLTFEGPTP